LCGAYGGCCNAAKLAIAGKPGRWVAGLLSLGCPGVIVGFVVYG